MGGLRRAFDLADGLGLLEEEGGPVGASKPGTPWTVSLHPHTPRRLARWRSEDQRSSNGEENWRRTGTGEARAKDGMDPLRAARR